MCGGTYGDAYQSAWTAGLSPRVRGNRLCRSNACLWPRSIPACAGEPQCLNPNFRWSAVYPRVCGGTSNSDGSVSAYRGLSPRVRGNLPDLVLCRERVRSIPACAGEPHKHPAPPTPAQVYPRVCGGTAASVSPPSRLAGLSPRVRGNPAPSRRPLAERGSIPACAGEPRAGVADWQGWRVYPRVCGGTRPSRIPESITSGLSPRVRGNPDVNVDSRLRRGSIPACAGEPPSSTAVRYPIRVYPRVCGGTDDAAYCKKRSRGLSPRVRGNRRKVEADDLRRGSIPACAGEPAKGRSG